MVYYYAIRRNPCIYMYIFMKEKGVTYGHIVESTEFFNDWTGLVSHSLIQAVSYWPDH